MNNRLSAISIQKLNRQIATINSWPAFEVNGFLDEHKDKALALVLTLKKYANPLSVYPIDPAVDEDLTNIKSCLEHPEKFQPGLTLNEAERQYLIELLRLKLDTLANEICTEHHISQEDIDKAVLKHQSQLASLAPQPENDEQPSIENQWWNSLTTSEQARVREKYNSLNDSQREHLNQRIYYVYNSNYYDDEYNYYQMSLIDAELNYFALRTVFDLSAIAIRGLIYGADIAFQIGMAIGQSQRHSSSSNSRGSNVSGEGLGLFALIAVGIALVLAAIIGSVYALKKCFNSILNIFKGDKIVRSLYRLTGTAGGVAAGFFIGSIAGAVLGSAFPVIGTGVGAILGMVVGVGVGAGAGTLIAKYTAKLISYIVYKDELNPTNPDKWRLSKQQMLRLQGKGVSIEQVNKEIRHIKEEKSKIGMSGSFFWTDARKAKNYWNTELNNIKTGKFINQYPRRYHLFTPENVVVNRMDREQSSNFRAV